MNTQSAASFALLSAAFAVVCVLVATGPVSPFTSGIWWAIAFFAWTGASVLFGWLLDK